MTDELRSPGRPMTAPAAFAIAEKFSAVQTVLYTQPDPARKIARFVGVACSHASRIRRIWEVA
jgi:hypothetical protein